MDSAKLRDKFPILKQKINGKRLVYLDNGATSQKPQCVIDAISNYYTTTNANIHRGAHTLGDNATDQYEATRKTAQEFINAKSEAEIIFTKNATESANLIAATFGKSIKEGDEIIVSALEHHANLVPWQQLCKASGATLKIIPLTDELALDYSEYENILSEKTKIVAITGMSNVTGEITDLQHIIQEAHNVGAKVLVDASQYAVHHTVDVQDLNCDFLIMTAHKICGPTGVGVLYGKQDILESLPPFLFGGDMVDTVDQFDATWNNLPWKFEAGTPNIAGVIAFKSALDFITEVGLDAIFKHDNELTNKAIERFSEYPEVTIYAPKDPTKRSSLFSFSVKRIHAHDLATIFDSEGVAIRAGNHCAQPLLKNFNVPATARISFFLYNTEEDIDAAEKALQKAIRIFA